MILLTDLDFSLPLKNPVVIFSLVLFIILFAPILLDKLKIPHLIGLIIAGIIIGPYGFNLLLRDSSIVLFGTVGLLYIMFIAGLEIDLEEFRRNRLRSLIFGFITFLTPVVLGYFSAFYLLQFSFASSLLLASMLGAHTLLAYPITSRYGVSRIKAVTLTIGGTIIADILALLVLAAITGTTKGTIGPGFWIQLAISSIVFGMIVFLVFPLIARWFFKKFSDNISQYIFVLAMVFLGSFLAEAAGLEAIIGAFLSGLSLNKFIPRSSPLMNRIEFVGNAIFIPFFLIGVGMLVDLSVLFKGWNAARVTIVMIIVAVVGKYIASWFTQKSFRLTSDERQMIFGLSNARVGATLAVVLVGYNIIIRETDAGEPIRLLSEDVLNGTIFMILVTCTISSFIVEKASRKLALKEETPLKQDEESNERILISLAYPETVPELVDLGLMLKPKKSSIPVYALHIISDESGEQSEAEGKKMMDKAIKHAAATENVVTPLTRFDMNISNGIIYTIKEQNITDVLIGMHQQANQKDFLGNITETVVRRIQETIYIYKDTQPFNTLQRIVVTATANAELEPGFRHWVDKLFLIAKEAGLPLVYYAQPDTLRELRKIHLQSKQQLKTEFNEFNDWNDFLILSREVKQNDLFVIVSSRNGHISYSSQLEKLPYYLSRYFINNSFMIIYPKQLNYDSNVEDIQRTDGALMESISNKIKMVNKSTGRLANLFGKKRKK